MAEELGAPESAEETTVEDLAASFEAEINPPKKTGKAPVNDVQDAEGGDDEPESGESESDEEQDEAESEDDDEQEDGEAESQEQPRYKVKVDGQEIEVSLDEALAGYSREADFTRRNQAHAEEVRKWEGEKAKALESDRAALAQEREQYKAVLGVWENQLKQALGNSEGLEALRRDNPGEWSAVMTERYEMQSRLQAITAEQAKLADQDKTKQESELKQKAAAEAVKMLEVIPEWKDPAVYKADSDRIFAYARDRKFTNEEVSRAVVLDHRLAPILKDAAAYRALQDKKPAVQKKVETAKALPPGNASPQMSKGSKVARIQQRLAKSGRVDDLAAYFAASD